MISAGTDGANGQSGVVWAKDDREANEVDHDHQEGTLRRGRSGRMSSGARGTGRMCRPVQWNGALMADLFRKFHMIGLKLSGTGSGKAKSGTGMDGGGRSGDGELAAELVRALAKIRSLQV